MKKENEKKEKIIDIRDKKKMTIIYPNYKKEDGINEDEDNSSKLESNNETKKTDWCGLFLLAKVRLQP